MLVSAVFHSKPKDISCRLYFCLWCGMCHFISSHFDYNLLQFAHPTI
jgi:hypothetical protein